MDSKNIKGLCEAYVAIYDDEVKEDLEIQELEDLAEEDLSFIDDLSDNELTQIMEELAFERKIYLDECIESLEVFLEENASLYEARLTPKQQKMRKEFKAKQKAELSASAAAAERRRQVGRLKDAASRAMSGARGVVGSLQAPSREGRSVSQKLSGMADTAKKRIGDFIEAQRRRVADIKQQSHVGLAKYASRRNLMPGAGLKTRSSRGRGELRGAIVSDIAQRASGRASKELEKARAVPGKVKTGVRGLLRRGAEKVAQKATSFAQRMSEETNLILSQILDDLVYEGYAVDYDDAADILESLNHYDYQSLIESYIEDNTVDFDFYDMVLDHLIDEGYAETIEDAETIMANMGQEWRDEILDEVTGFGGHIDPRTGKLTGNVSPAQQRYDQWVSSGLKTDTRRSKHVYENPYKTRTNPGINYHRDHPDWKEKQEPNLVMTPARRAELAAKRAERQGDKKRANSIRARMSNPNMR